MYTVCTQRELLARPSADLVDGLVRLEKAVDRARPLRGKHRAGLAGGIAELSGLLTSEREDLPPDYMSRPPHLAAYLRWFLPWNIHRQGRLLQGLELDLPDEPRVLDVGAGPLTFAIALWLARPDLRERPLQLVAVDRSEAALKAAVESDPAPRFANEFYADVRWRDSEPEIALAHFRKEIEIRPDAEFSRSGVMSILKRWPRR